MLPPTMSRKLSRSRHAAGGVGGGQGGPETSNVKTLRPQIYLRING